VTSYAVPTRRGIPTACWGMSILIASEATLFAACIATYLYLRSDNPVWPPAGDAGPRVLVPAILVAILVATSAAMQLASLAARAGRVVATRCWVLLALVVQAAYLAYAVHDYVDQLDRLPASRDAYSSAYYTLLGLDHLHIAVGIVFNLWLLGKLVTGLTRYRVDGVQAIAWYWHAVNVITLAVFATLFSARL
jgi:cytochrome c oxidase subunit I+III